MRLVRMERRAEEYRRLRDEVVDLRSAPCACEPLDDKCASSRGLLDLCDEMLLQIAGYLDPYSLLRAGITCSDMYRICTTDSLWAGHCKVTFGSYFRSNDASYSPKEAFKLLYMWTTLYQSLTYNRPLQDFLYTTVPPKRYWCRWLTLEDFIFLPPIQFADHEIGDIWGIVEDVLDEKHEVTDEIDESLEVGDQSIFKYEWKDLHDLALAYHGSLSNLQEFQLEKMSSECHEDLEGLFSQYMTDRYKWAFSYWLFGLPKPYAQQLKRTYLWWKNCNKRRVSTWGTTNCDLHYLASLHSITLDYWNGKLAGGQEKSGIKTIENYFSMSRSLLAWVLGRKWCRQKQKRIYMETLEGVYRYLKFEMQASVITHEQFWSIAKLLLSRICKLEETAGNYINSKLICSLPCYRLYMANGEPLHLCQIKDFLFRKQLINNWLVKEENHWARSLLPSDLSRLLEYETKINEDELHGDTLTAYLSRLIWLYLHSGHQLYMEAIKGFVLQSAYATYASQVFEKL